MMLLFKQTGDTDNDRTTTGRLAQIAVAQERWERRLFRAADELRKLRDQRKRLLKPTSIKNGRYQPVTELNDEIPRFLR